MMLNDASADVRLAALRPAARCQDGSPEALSPFAEHRDKRVRAAALAGLSRHDALGRRAWFRRGLRDPEPCVRQEVSRQLDHLDPVKHRAVFELALYDADPQVVRRAEKATAGKGCARLTW
jgi:HEAT repeat protein